MACQPLSCLTHPTRHVLGSNFTLWKLVLGSEFPNAASPRLFEAPSAPAEALRNAEEADELLCGAVDAAWLRPKDWRFLGVEIGL